MKKRKKAVPGRRIHWWNTREAQTAAYVADSAVGLVGGILGVVLKVLISVVLVVLLTGLMFTCIFAYYVKTNLSTAVNITLEDYSLSLSSSIYAYNADGSTVELATLQTSENRVWVEYKDIPPYFEKAAVAIEDKRFYEHKGVDWYRTAGAFVNMFVGMKNDFGGSTITQQLIKNITTDNEATVQRKLVEIFRALELEKTYTKEEIVEWYLNVVYFGEGANGIGMAAHTYFGKDVQDLSLAECASIIGITNNPSKFSPFASVKNNKARQELILYEMYDQGFITHEEYEEAVAEDIQSHFVRGENEVYEQEIYSYYVEVVIQDVIKDMQEQLGLSEDAARQRLYHGGLQIYACLDPYVQLLADNVYQNVNALPKAYYWDRSIGYQPEFQSACVIMDPYNGEIKAIVGRVGEKTANFGWNLATDARRPAGSSFKPLAVYGPAIDVGLITPRTIFLDKEGLRLNGTTWYPRNDGGYAGYISVYDALVASKNTVAAQIMDRLTPAVAYEYVTERMGFKLLEKDADYAPMALGQLTNGVTVREMAQAYTTFPNDGIMNYGRTYSLVTDSNGVTVLDNAPKTSYVFRSDTARMITEMLESAARYGTGYEVYLGRGKMPFAGKTGTTSDNYDRWFCGYSPYYVCAVWTGYESPSTMYFYGNPAAQIWKSVMEPLHRNLTVVSFSNPGNRGQETGLAGVTPTPRPSPTPTPRPTPEPAVISYE